MKTYTSQGSSKSMRESEYSVEFECISHFLIHFKTESGLTDRQILAVALKNAQQSLGRGVSLTLERAGQKGSSTLNAVGVDTRSGRVLGKPVHDRPKLRLLRGL